MLRSSPSPTVEGVFLRKSVLEKIHPLLLRHLRNPHHLQVTRLLCRHIRCSMCVVAQIKAANLVAMLASRSQNPTRDFVSHDVRWPC